MNLSLMRVLALNHFRPVKMLKSGLSDILVVVRQLSQLLEQIRYRYRT